LIIFKLTAIILETSLPQPSGVKLYTVHFIMLPALEYSILSRSLQNIFEDGMFTWQYDETLTLLSIKK